MSLLRSLLYVFLLAGLCACGSSGTEDSSETSSQELQRTIHPTSQNIPSDEAVDHVIPQAQDNEVPPRIRMLARRLSQAERIRAFGKSEGEREEMIGQIADITVGGDENIYLVDARYNEVRIYDEEDGFLAAFGGPGRGPSEFSRPGAIAINRDDLLVVADQGEGQYSLFQRHNSSFVEEASVQYLMAEVDLCWLGDRIFLRGVKASAPEVQDGSIHVYSASGDLERSFGRTYQASNPLVRLRLSEGSIACSAEAKRIVATFDNLPVIYGYAPSGELAWTSKLDRFTPFEVVGRRDGGAEFNLGKRESDFVLRATSLPGGYVLVQVAHRTPEALEARQPFVDLHTYLFDAESGEGMYVGATLPPVYAATRDRLIAGTDNPYPQLMIYRYAQAGGS